MQLLIPSIHVSTGNELKNVAAPQKAQTLHIA